MKNTLIVAFLLLSALDISAQSAREISDKAFKTINFPAMEMTSTLKIYDSKGRLRERQVSIASKKFGDVNKTMMKFTAPSDIKGTTLLIYDYEGKDDDMWIYMPALRKTRRIVSSEKGQNFMGSEFTNADMSKPNLNDFNYKILPDEVPEDKDIWIIETACKNEEIEGKNGYSKKHVWIEKENYLCYKIEYYDLDGSLYKIQRIQDYIKQADGKYIAFYMEMDNMENGRKSIMTIDKFQEGSDLPESFFTPAMLKQ